MIRKFNSVVALLCIIAYVFALGFTAYRIVSSVSERKGLAEKEFRDLVDRASAASVLGFMEQPFKDAIKDTVLSSKTLDAIIVSGPTGPEYALEKRTGYLTWVDSIPRFVFRFGTSRAPLFSPLRIDGIRNATISAVADYIDYPLIHGILIQALGAIGIALIVALFTLIFTVTPRAAPTVVDDRKKTKSYKPQESMVEEQPFDIPDLGLSHIQVAEEDCGPQGLYSSRSNICWESYTHDRLESELHRCASFEQDLCFIVVESLNFEEWESSYRNFTEAAIGFFTFRDLLFEKGRGGISIILPNVDLDHGIRMAEEFRKKIGALPSQGGHSENRSDLVIGLSSRSGRLVDADRLMLEAERALEKAKADPSSPVIAFKSDPERYRAFIQTKQ